MIANCCVSSFLILFVLVEEPGCLHDVCEHLPHPPLLPTVPEVVGQVGQASLDQYDQGHPHVVGVGLTIPRVYT